MLVILPSLVSAIPLGRLTGCDLSRAVLPLPATAAAGNVTLDAGEKVVNVALGVGVQVRSLRMLDSSSKSEALTLYCPLPPTIQNYTCVAGAYTTNMAVATLFDASCGEQLRLAHHSAHIC